MQDGNESTYLHFLWETSKGADQSEGPSQEATA